ncbi:MAG TPA: NADH-dependent alcohol dehydrogenase, partial [Magnetospirillum sp.]|nr:NADH-dependent alcohol dehydrogenase [Magnetospirillum sp.]
VWPGVVAVKREHKRAKLLQYAARIWNLTEGAEDARIDQAIAKTRAFFESVGVPAGLGGYEVPAGIANTIADRLATRGGLPLGERGDIDAGTVRRILEAA